jgi:hypothetical protein
MVQILKCVTRVWQASQVEFHGQYSAPRLLELIKYLEHSTPVHVLAVALVTPLPCLVNVISMDLIPLSPPDAGWMANWAFWLRAFGFTCISTMSNFAMHQRAMGLPSISMRKMAAVVVFISFGVALVSIGLAVTIGFPVPFLAMLTGLPWTLFFQVTIAIEWGSYIRQNPRVGADRNEFSKIVSIHGLMIVVYPVYYFVYQQLGPMAQGAFSLMLPVIKTGLKNVISKRFRILSDLRPEETVLTIEVFSALFVAFSMQNSLSFLPVVLLTTVDVVHAAVSVYDIYHIANELMETRARIQTLTPALDMRVDGTLDTRDWLAGVMHEASALLTQLDAESRDRIASTAPLRSLAALHGSNADQVATRSLVVMPRVVSVKRVTPTSANVPRDLPPRSKKRTQVVAFTLERPRSSNVASQLVREQELFVVQVLRFLHTTEFVVLVEFVEVMIPTIYCECKARTL